MTRQEVIDRISDLAKQAGLEIVGDPRASVNRDDLIVVLRDPKRPHGASAVSISGSEMLQSGLALVDRRFNNAAATLEKGLAEDEP